MAQESGLLLCIEQVEAGASLDAGTGHLGHRSPATSGDKMSLFKGFGELLTPAPSHNVTGIPSTLQRTHYGHGWAKVMSRACSVAAFSGFEEQYSGMERPSSPGLSHSSACTLPMCCQSHCESLPPCLTPATHG